MAEIKNVAGAGGGAGQHLLSAAADFCTVGQQHGGIEIALHGAIVADQLPSVVEIDPPVHADHAAAGLRLNRQQRGLPVPK